MTIYNAQLHRRNRYPGKIDPQAVSPFSPISLGNLRAWYQTNKEVGYGNGDPISTLTDWSGNGYDLSGTANYVVSGGIKYVDSDYMSNGSAPALGNAAYSMCIYGDSYNTNGALFCVGSTTQNLSMLAVARNEIRSWNYNASFTDTGDACLITVTYDTSSFRVYKNDALHATLTQGGFNIFAGLYMFRLSNADRQSTLRARFGAVYTKVLSLTDIEKLYAYVNSFSS